MEWKLGVSMSSNYCKSLGSPHVSLQLKVAGSDGQPTTHTVEMSIPQFQVVCVCGCGCMGVHVVVDVVSDKHVTLFGGHH